MKTLNLAAAAALALTASSAMAGTAPFCNTGAITIASGPGAAAPYPSPVVVSGLGPSITTFTVSVFGLTHTFPDDVDLLLVGPTGANLIIMSDVGAGNDAAAVDLLIDDSAGGLMPDTAQLASGSYQPSNYVGADGVDVFAAPAPAGPYGSPATTGSDTLTSIFAGTNPNGTWNLYAMDDAAGDSGSIGGGWCLAFGTTPVTLQSFDVD